MRDQIDMFAVLLGGAEADAERGLTDAQADERRGKYGSNELAQSPPPPLWIKLAGQFKDLVIWILIVAAVVSGWMGEWIDALAILAIVVMNGVIGFLQEERAERALAALQKMSAPLARVLRGGKLRSVPAAELVPGDVLELEAGDYIPADTRLLRSTGFLYEPVAAGRGGGVRIAAGERRHAAVPGARV